MTTNHTYAHSHRAARLSGKSRLSSAIDVAAYQLQSKLPGELKGKLPTAKQLADVVRGEMEGGK